MAVTTTKDVEERTWRIVINTPKNKEYTLTIFRECIDESGRVTKLPNKTFTYTELASDVFDTIGETEYTIADLSAKLADYCDIKST